MSVGSLAWLQCILAALFFEKTAGDDAYHIPLQDAMRKGELQKDGFFLLANRRESLGCNILMKNANSAYPRKVYVITLSENTHASHCQAMTVACNILNRPENNTFDIPFAITEESDITELVMPSVDEWLLDNTVVKVIGNLYNNVDCTWAIRNPVDADYFFSGPHYACPAVVYLGYPDV